MTITLEDTYHCDTHGDVVYEISRYKDNKISLHIIDGNNSRVNISKEALDRIYEEVLVVENFKCQ